MTLGGIVFLLVMIVAVILFIYFLAVTARGWGILNTVMLSFLFIECWVFMVFAAGVHKNRVALTQQSAQAQKAAEDATARTEVLLYGTSTASSETLEAVVPIKGMLRRLTADRGRLWRRVSFLAANNGTYQLELTAAPADANVEDPAAAVNAGAADSQSLPGDIVVYGFAEEENEEGLPLPAFYLGEFKVTESNQGQIKLVPTMDLEAAQQAKIDSGEAASWSLYELLPIDSHEAFAAKGSTPSEEALFGRIDEDQLDSDFAGLPQKYGIRDDVLASYKQDGKRAPDTADPGSVWIEVNMVANHVFDVDSDQEANASLGGYFDPIGRAVDVRLKTGNKDRSVTLTSNIKRKRIVLKQEAANALIPDKAELVERVYVRPLNDYEEIFSQSVKLRHELSERIAIAKRDSEQIRSANALGTSLIADQQVETQKLSSDVDSFKREVAVLETASQDATQSLTQLKTRMSSLYRSIQQRYSQLVGN